MGIKEVIILIIIAVVSYFIGNFSPAITLGKFMGVDVKKEGSGNAGTTNVFRLMGWKAALITLVVDVLKGFVAVELGIRCGNYIGGMVAFACVILGHVFPAIYHFKGGKGVATAFGAAIALNWPSAFAVLLVVAIVFIATRRMSAASLAGCVAYPLLVLYYEPKFLFVAIPMALFVIYNHRANIKRLINGTEKPIVFSRSITEKLEDNGDRPSVVDAAITSIENAKNSGEPQAIDYYADIPYPKLSKDEKKNIAVIGNGSFGTAMANHLAHKGYTVTIYGRNKEAINKMKLTHMNERYLPYAILSNKLKYTNVLKTACSNKDIVIFALPSQTFRAVALEADKLMKPGTIVVNLAKGIELNTLDRMSEVAQQTIPSFPYVTLSGPSHAEEVVRNLPAGLVAASKDEKAAKTIQDVFMSDKLRIYTHRDVKGVELAGALKNVAAIATGISDGMHFGNNARAALMTRATHEIARLGKALGANETTFAGLSGIGDLMVTCSTNLSRNRRCGLYIGLGLTPDEAVEKVGSTVEGFYTAQSAKELADRVGIEMPIVNATYAVLKGIITPQQALIELMSRDKKDEVQ